MAGELLSRELLQELTFPDRGHADRTRHRRIELFRFHSLDRFRKLHVVVERRAQPVSVVLLEDTPLGH